MEYREFLEKKIPVAQLNGFEVAEDELSPVLKPHQRDIVLWAVKGGQRAIFASFGLGKGLCQLEITRLIHKKTGGKTLIVCPLGVRQEFTRDAKMIDVELKFIRRNSEMDDEHPYYITNYESIRDGRLNPNEFTAVSLDEASILRSYGSKTYQSFLELFPTVPYKFVATATPAPNRYKELIHYAGFLGIMQTSQSLTRFFQRDSTKANNLTLYPHKEKEFWMWMHSWAVFLQRPSELGYSDEGYEMPELKVFKHEVAATDEHPVDRDGQIHLFNEPVLDLKNAAREKRESIDARIAEMKRILEADKESHYIIWHDLESERHAIKKALPEAAIVYGSLDLETREQRVIDFSEGKYQYFASKPEISGSGCNFQHHCHKAIFLGVGYKFNDFIQSVHRIYRYLQSYPCEIHLIYTESEREVLRVLEQKWDEHNKMMERMSEIVKEYGLNDLGLDGLKQGMLADRKVVKGKLFEVAHNDCVLEAKLREDDSVDEIITSIPFCYDSETEVLTDNGWKGFGDVDISKDRIATYNPDTQCMEYQTASHRVWEHYDGEMIEFTGRAFNLSVTPNHRMYAAQQSGPINIKDYSIFTADEITKDFERYAEEHEVNGNVEFRLGWCLLCWPPLGTTAKAFPEWVNLQDLTPEIRHMPKRYQYSGMIGCVTVPNGLIIVRRNGFPCISGNSNHYQYTANYADFGETDNNEHFWAQMDYLTPELLRILRPGRICCIHVKDRILFGNVTGAGAPTVSPFHAEAIFHYKKHGFDYLGMITVITDVVRENNQTYRLGWTEQCKDGTKMGVGSPEYVLLFRKPQTDRTKGYADVPVVKSKEEYSRARWQIDAHAFWRCSGDRLLTAEEWEGYGPDVLAKAFRDTTREKIYDYEAHVAVGEALDEKGKLPSTFMAIAPGSFAEDVWDDVNRMQTLNTTQSQKGRELHVCLARGSLVLTRGGFKPIQDVEIGDMVLTHKGNWKPVIAKACTGINPVVRMNAYGTGELVLTPNHKLWARRNLDNTPPEWIEAEDTKGGWVNLKLPPVEESELSANEWIMVGWYLAKGYVEGNYGDFIFPVHPTVDRVGDEIEVAGLSEICRDDNGNRYRRLDSTLNGRLARMLRKCGCGAIDKQIPIEGLCLNKELSWELLFGYISEAGRYKGEEIKTVTRSRALALGIAMLVQRARNYVPSVYAYEPTEKSGEYSWVAHWRESDKHCHAAILDDGAWLRVHSAHRFGNSEAETWSLQVADDASYTAEGCIVKNCPLQFNIVDRLIERYSNKGELIYDPFAGIMTVPYRAILLGRRGGGSELNEGYFQDGVNYLQRAENDLTAPTLFDAEGLNDGPEAKSA